MSTDEGRDRLALRDPLAADGCVSLAELLSLEFDVRAPLHQVTGYLSMLTPPAELAPLAPAAVAALHQVGRLVESAVDLAHSRAGGLVRVPIDLVRFWQQVQADSAGLVDLWHPGGALCFAIDGTPAVIIGDAAALRRAVLNLLEAALYWAPAGEVVVTAGQADHTWVVELCDAGPGLPAGVAQALADPAGGGPLGLRQAWAVARGHGGGLAFAPGRMRLVIPLGT